MTVLGFDAGITGACTIIIDGKHHTTIDYSIDPQTGYLDRTKLLKDIRDNASSIDAIALEKQFNPNNKPQKGMWTNAVNYGILISVVQDIKPKAYEEVDSKVWQTFFRVKGSSKAVIAQRAIDRGFKKELAKGVRGGLKHGRTDSYLIGLYFHNMVEFRIKRSKK